VGELLLAKYKPSFLRSQIETSVWILGGTPYTFTLSHTYQSRLSLPILLASISHIDARIAHWIAIIFLYSRPLPPFHHGDTPRRPRPFPPIRELHLPQSRCTVLSVSRFSQNLPLAAFSDGSNAVVPPHRPSNLKSLCGFKVRSHSLSMLPYSHPCHPSGISPPVSRRMGPGMTLAR
jgi:hypothetical protein